VELALDYLAWIDALAGEMWVVAIGLSAVQVIGGSHAVPQDEL
jgi:hypothetical protein